MKHTWHGEGGREPGREDGGRFQGLWSGQGMLITCLQALPQVQHQVLECREAGSFLRVQKEALCQTRKNHSIMDSWVEFCKPKMSVLAMGWSLHLEGVST